MNGDKYMIDIEKLNALRQELQETQAQIEIKKAESKDRELAIADKFLELYHKVDDLYKELDNNGHNLTRRFTYPLETEASYINYPYVDKIQMPLDLVAFMYKSQSGTLKSYVCPILREVNKNSYDIRFYNDFSNLTADALLSQMTPGTEIKDFRDIGFPVDIYKEITDKADDFYEKFEKFVEKTLKQIYENKIKNATSELDELEMETNI